MSAMLVRKWLREDGRRSLEIRGNAPGFIVTIRDEHEALVSIQLADWPTPETPEVEKAWRRLVLPEMK
jgi:hypothetical protein